MITLEKIFWYHRLENYSIPYPILTGDLELKQPAAILAAEKPLKVVNHEIDEKSELSFDADFIKDSNFDVSRIFRKLLHENILIPSNLKNLPTSFRLPTRNKTFVSNFVSLCIWKHMNDDSPWIAANDLDVNKKPKNVREFNNHVKILKSKYYDEFWAPIEMLKIKDLHAEKVFHYCKNTRVEITKGLWYGDKHEAGKLYHKFKEMLDEIGFKMLKGDKV